MSESGLRDFDMFERYVSDSATDSPRDNPSNSPSDSPSDNAIVDAIGVDCLN